MHTQTPLPLTFALAGELVSQPADAKRILVDAIKTGKEWLVPQAESVLRQLRAPVMPLTIQGGAA